MTAGGDQPRKVRHIDEKTRTDRSDDFRHAGKVDFPRIGGAAGNQEFRRDLARLILDAVMVDEAGLPVHGIVVGLEPAAGKIGSAPRTSPASG